MCDEAADVLWRIFMRYYHYGTKRHENLLNRSGMPLSEQADAFCRGDRDLIIEDDTIYEIDRECLGCRQERVRAGKRV